MNRPDRPLVCLIAGVARNGAIGRDNALLWRLPEDLQRFKRLTMGSPLIMGRRTWDSIGRPLPGRRSLVISRNPAWQAAGAERAASLDDAIARAGAVPKVFVIGGAEVYALALPRADELLLTEVDADYDADTFFPPWRREDFIETGRAEHAGGDGRPAYRFVDYRRRGAPAAPGDAVRRLAWPHGEAELQRLGAMLAPVVFRAPGHADFSPLQVAPWADEPGSDALPGILRRLRGDWPCVPFGRTDRPAGLPAGWTPREPDDAEGHGHGSNHDWTWLEPPDALSLRLAIDYPETSPVRRLIRTVSALPNAPALHCTLEVEVRRPCRLPIALHPTLRLDAGRVALHLPHAAPACSYPVPAEPGVSRLAPGESFAELSAAPLAGGATLDTTPGTRPDANPAATLDLSRYPLPFDTEELLQLPALTGPARADYLDLGWSLEIDWDRAALPDLMLWVSHRGRSAPPWNGRHLAIGLEPVNGPFDLGRVAVPPPAHPLASRTGIALEPGRAWVLHSELRARPLPPR